jgi:ATP/maltotriose-dependent transcriptional regulator MalT
VLGLVERGLSNQEIGAELFVGPATAFTGSPPGRTTE